MQIEFFEDVVTFGSIGIFLVSLTAMLLGV